MNYHIESFIQKRLARLFNQRPSSGYKECFVVIDKKNNPVRSFETRKLAENFITTCAKNSQEPTHTT